MVDFIQRLEGVCAKHPDAPALQDSERIVTYGELWEAIQTDLPAQRIIGLHFRKSIDYVLTLLAVWRAGSAFLPLDRELPEARLQLYREQARPDLVLEELPAPVRGPAG